MEQTTVCLQGADKSACSKVGATSEHKLCPSRCMRRGAWDMGACSFFCNRRHWVEVKCTLLQSLSFGSSCGFQ